MDYFKFLSSVVGFCFWGQFIYNFNFISTVYFVMLAQETVGGWGGLKRGLMVVRVYIDCRI